MTTAVFVLVWVALGLGVLAAAMAVGRRRGTGRRSRRRRRATVVGFVGLLAVLGVGVPAAVIASVTSRNSIPDSGIDSLTATEERGRELFSGRCSICHRLDASNAVAQVGPDLDELRPTRELVLDAIDKGRSRGRGQMAADLYTGADAEAVASYVARAVGTAE